MLNDTKGVKIYDAPCGKFKVFFDMPVIVHELMPTGNLRVNQIVFHVNYAEKDFDEGYSCGLVRLDSVHKGISLAKKIEDVIIPQEVKLFNASSGSECNYRD